LKPPFNVKYTGIFLYDTSDASSVLGSHFPQHKTRFTGIQVVFNPWGCESMYSMGGAFGR